MSPGVGSCCCDCPKTYFCSVCCYGSQWSSRAGASPGDNSLCWSKYQSQEAQGEKSWHSNQRGSSCSTGSFVLSLLKPPLTHNWHHRSDYIEENYFHLTFWWTIYVSAGCSLKHTDLFRFIHSDSGDYFRTQVTGNKVFCSSSGNRTRQSTDSRGTGAMTSCACCTFSASLPLKETWNRPFIRGVDFAESNQTTVCLCLQKLPM